MVEWFSVYNPNYFECFEIIVILVLTDETSLAEHMNRVKAYALKINEHKAK